MNALETGGILGSLSAIMIWFKFWYDKISPWVIPLVNSAEEEYKKCIIDGIITCDERKKIVMAGIKGLEDAKKIKLNFITRWMISKVVDFIAQRLPKIDTAELVKKD